MGQYYEAGHRTFVPDAVYPRCTRVKANPAVPNGVTVAGAADVDVGTLSAASFMWPGEAAGQTYTVRPCDVHLCTAQGTQEFIAAGAIGYGVLVYPAANGQVSTTVSGSPIGTALSAATAVGDLIEVLRLNH